MNFYINDFVLKADDKKQLLYIGHVISKKHSLNLENNDSEPQLTVGELMSKIATSDDLSNVSDAHVESTINKILEAVGDKPTNSEYGNSLNPLDFDSDISESLIFDEDDIMNEQEPQSKSGEVYVSWLLHGEPIQYLIDNSPKQEPGSELILYDRQCYLFDTVKYENTDQCGIITAYKKTCQLEILNQDALIVDVDFKDLKINHTDYGGLSYIIYNSWLGRLKKLQTDLIVKFNDGALLYVTEDSLNEFELYLNKTGLDEIYDTEGQFEGSILFGDARDLKSKKARFYKEGPIHNTIWLRNLRRKETVYVVVKKSVHYSATVEWIANRSNSDGSSPPAVLDRQQIAKSQLLTDSDHIYDDVDYQCFVYNYELKENDLLIYKESDEMTESALYKLYKLGTDHGLRTERVRGVSTVSSETAESAAVFEPDLDSLILMDNSESLLQKVMLPGSESNKKHVITNPKRSKYSSATTSERTRLKSTNSTTSQEDTNQPSNASQKPNTKSSPNIHKFADMKDCFSLDAGCNVPVLILATQTKVQVTWQDGTVENDIDTTKLVIVDNFDEHDFYPGFFVSEKCERELTSQFRYGTILSANNKDRVCMVQWFDVPDSTCPNKVIKIGDPEEVGVYDIINHTKYNYREPEYVLVDPDLYVDKVWPVGKITGYEPNEGKIVLTFPDSSTGSLFPTQLLLTLSSYWHENPSDDWSVSDGSSVSFESDESDWETENEEDVFSVDADYQKKINEALSKYIIPILRLTQKSRTHIGQMLDSLDSVFSFPPCPSGMSAASQELFSRYGIAGLINKINFIKARLVRANSILKDERFTKQISLFKLEEMTRKSWEKDGENNIFKRIESFLTDQREDSLIGQTLTEKIKDIMVKRDKRKLEGAVNYSRIENRPTELELLNEFKQTLQTILGETIEKVKNLERFLLDWIMEKGQEIPKESVTLRDSKESLNDIFIPELMLATKDKPNNMECVSPIQGDTELNNLESLKDNFEKLVPPSADNGNCSQPVDTLPATREATIEEKPNEEIDVSHLAESLKSPSFQAIPTNERGIFNVIEAAPENHKYFSTIPSSNENSSQAFMKAWKKDIKLLSTSLPRGVFVKSFENRMDLFSVMIIGPSGTPYQHALFFFSIRLPPSYPNEPPKVHYESLASERVNPNLYVDGNVCLSLLGTWMGKGSENWNPKTSTMLQLIVSLQGLILVPEPFYNEAGYESKRGSEELRDSSKKYNESAIINIVHSMAELLVKPFGIFRSEIIEHFSNYGQEYISLLKYWLNLDNCENGVNTENTDLHPVTSCSPEFPLAPVTRGFQISLKRNIEVFENAYNTTISEMKQRKA